MLTGYARVSKTDGSQSLDLQRDALRAAGVDEVNLYHDYTSGLRDDRPGLDSCLRTLRKGNPSSSGGRKFAPSKAQVRLAQAAMAHRDTSVSALCRELGIRPVTLYRYVGPQGQLREQGQKVLAS